MDEGLVAPVLVKRLRGLDRLAAVSTVLQRTRLADPLAGIWEAADVQWWWRRPRASDDVPTTVWFDDDGPVASAYLTDWGDRWQVDALVVPGTVDLAEVWTAALAAAPKDVELEVLARDDDADLLGLIAADGFVATDDGSGTTWMDAADRPPVAPPPAGYRIVDRATSTEPPHWMRPRNGDVVEERLRETSLYDASLDLAVVAENGEPVGYALYWFDPVTMVGQLEPMRVEDEHQRRGLARALLVEGLDRLATRGAIRLKVGFDGPAGEALYLGAGFVVDSMATSHRLIPT